PIREHDRRVHRDLGQEVKNGALWDHSRHFMNLRPAYAFGEWVLDSMPLPIGYGLTWWVTSAVYGLSPWLRTDLEANIRQALAHPRPELSPAELGRTCRSIAHRTFINRGFWFLDLSLMAGRRRFEDLFHFDMEGNWAALMAVRAAGRGAIL